METLIKNIIYAPIIGGLISGLYGVALLTWITFSKDEEKDKLNTPTEGEINEQRIKYSFFDGKLRHHVDNSIKIIDDGKILMNQLIRYLAKSKSYVEYNYIYDRLEYTHHKVLEQYKGVDSNYITDICNKIEIAEKELNFLE